MATYDLETMTLTERSVNRLRTTQGAIKRAMLEISLRQRIRNENIRRRTRVTDVLAKLKWQWVGHIGRQDRERWTIKIIMWRPRGIKRKVGRSQKRWLDDIKKVAGQH